MVFGGVGAGRIHIQQSVDPVMQCSDDGCGSLKGRNGLVVSIFTKLAV